ncbi:hypothetical protein [Acinetobacter sp. A47]|uniref:hypothetical protein n=1 Tax=Acinetobacter sp. A47 TaxID=1561217 RepID=UPI00068E2BA3|nr:hypothetical protein [Acinetobacter sp. A47]
MKKILLLSLIFGMVGCSKNNAIHADSDAPDKNNATVISGAQSKTKAPESKPIDLDTNWLYGEKKDEMRGKTTKFASLLSDNQVNFDFPYDGGSHLIITLKKKNAEPTDVLFSVTKGQYSCNTISDYCYASVKFDNQKIINIALSEPEQHSSDVLFIEDQVDADNFINSILKSKSVIIELPFYREGRQQFKFTLYGLKWDAAQNSQAKS